MPRRVAGGEEHLQAQRTDLQRLVRLQKTIRVRAGWDGDIPHIRPAFDAQERQVVFVQG